MSESASRGLLLTGGWLMHTSPAPGRFEKADLLIRDGRIAAIGKDIQPGDCDEEEDIEGLVIMPGLVVGHHHLYSALASTMPAPPRSPRNFHEILKLIWWRLDRALDLDTVELSGLAGAAEAACCGVTTIIDHHASPSCIEGSLDSLKDGIDAVGQRGVLCYEVTGRNAGSTEQDAGLAENARFILANKGPFFAGMVGAHAAFTIDDEGLRRCAALATKSGAGLHIHVAEDPCDDAICRERFGAPLMERLDKSGCLAPGNLLGHCTHLTRAEIQRAAAAGCYFAHNTRSNMNNAVGYAPIGEMVDRTVLGTDGIGSDLFEEFRAATFRSNEGKTGAGWDKLLGMVSRSAEVAGKKLGLEKLGRLEVGAPGDLCVFAPPPAMLPGAGGPAGHLLFSLASRHVMHTIVAGEFIYRDRELVRVRLEDIAHRAAEEVPGIWQRLPGGE